MEHTKFSTEEKLFMIGLIILLLFLERKESIMEHTKFSTEEKLFMIGLIIFVIIAALAGK